jgi:hypothetical protein
MRPRCAQLEADASRGEGVLVAENLLIDILIAGAIVHFRVETGVGFGKHLDRLHALALDTDLDEATQLGNA